MCLPIWGSLGGNIASKEWVLSILKFFNIFRYRNMNSLPGHTHTEIIEGHQSKYNMCQGSVTWLLFT